MKTIAILLSSLLITQTAPAALSQHIAQNSDPEIRQLEEAQTQTTAKINQLAKNITVRITAANNGGSGVLIAKKGNTYLVLTNAHVTRRSSQFEIQAPDGQKYRARTIDGGFDRNYDLALLEFTSSKQYQLANLSNPGVLKPNDRNIYSVGFPFNSKELRISAGEITQLSDIPFNNGTQIGYEIAKGQKGVRQGMSGGPIFDASGVFLGINTIGAAPILPNYTYNDGSKPLAKLAAKYRQANWGVPVYNFLIQVKPDILYGYKFNGLAVGKIQRQATLTGYMAKLNDTARKQTVRIENSGGNGSGVIIAKENSPASQGATTYYVLTAKHVLQNPKTNQKYTNSQIITYDQDRHSLTSNVIVENIDLAVIKFTTNSSYPLAQLSEHSPNNDDLVFVGGFPGRENINSPLWQWQLNPGFILDQESGKVFTQNNLSFANGYDMYYGSISYGGMSGGPILNSDGKVIGIHGRAETTDNAILGGSLGISIQSVAGLLDKLQIKPGLLNITKNSPTTLNDRDRQSVVTAMNNIAQPEPSADGKRWLAYGNQLTRTMQFDRAIVAFDKAIDKGEILNGNYGKTLLLLILGKYDAAKTAMDRAIALVSNQDRPKYYYFWKYQSRIFAGMGKFDEAIKAINEAIRLEPNDLNLLLEKAVTLTRNKQYADALAIFEKINRQPSAYSYFNLGLIKLESGDIVGASADINRSIKINPNYSNSYILRSLIKVISNDMNSALSDINRAISLSPNYNSGYLIRSILYLSLGSYKNALADSDKVIELSNVKGFVGSITNQKPITVLAYWFRGRSNIGLQKFNDAIVDLDRAIDLIKNQKVDTFNSETLPSAYLLRGETKFKLGDKLGAISDLTEAANLFQQKGDMKSYQQAKDFLEQKLNQKLAVTPRSGKDPKIELVDYDKKIALTPQNSALYLDRAILKMSKLNDLKGAISDYDKAISIDPKYAKAYAGRGLLKEKLNDNNGAISDYNKAIALNVDIPLDAIYLIRGNLKHYKLNDVNGGLADYNKAISFNPKLADAYLDRGNLKNYKLNDLSGAAADYNKTIELSPQGENAYLLRAMFKYQRLNDFKGAITDLNKSIELNSKFVDAYYNRGDLYHSLGNKVSAITDFQKVITLDKSSAVSLIAQGVVFLDQGSISQSIASFDRAAKISPDTSDIYKYRGLAYRRQGKNNAAIQDWRKAAKGYKQDNSQKDYNMVRGWLKDLGAIE
jgi:tetratricopeptide (TPR) repeat protein/S1-C subfamily serine protease